MNIIVLHLENNKENVVRILSEHGLDGRSDELHPRPVLRREISNFWDWDRKKLTIIDEKSDTGTMVSTLGNNQNLIWASIEKGKCSGGYCDNHNILHGVRCEEFSPATR